MVNELCILDQDCTVQLSCKVPMQQRPLAVPHLAAPCDNS